MSVQQEWEDAIAEAMKRPEINGNPSKARAYVVRTNPDLHKRFVIETNQAAGRAVPNFG